MRKILTFSLLALFSHDLRGEDVNARYIQGVYAVAYSDHKLLSPSKLFSCGQKVQLKQDYEDKISEFEFDNKKYFMKTSMLSLGKLPCWQTLYPRFFYHIDVDYKDLFYWGKLQEKLKEDH